MASRASAWPRSSLPFGACPNPFRTAKKVKIYANPEMPWTLDGEREEGHGEILVENLHHAISLVRRAEP